MKPPPSFGRGGFWGRVSWSVSVGHQSLLLLLLLPPPLSGRRLLKPPSLERSGAWGWRPPQPRPQLEKEEEEEEEEEEGGFGGIEGLGWGLGWMS